MFTRQLCLFGADFLDAAVFILRLYKDTQETGARGSLSGKAAKRLIAEGGLRRLLHAPPPVSPSANPKLPELEALTEGRAWAWAPEEATGEAEFGSRFVKSESGRDRGKEAT